MSDLILLFQTKAMNGAEAVIQRITIDTGTSNYVILVETRVWVDYFNGIKNPQSEYLDRALASGQVVIGDMTLLEILQGLEQQGDFDKARDALRNLNVLPLLDQEKAIYAAQLQRSLRDKGVNIDNNSQLIHAALCLNYDMPLLFTSPAFDQYVEHVGLQDALDHPLESDNKNSASKSIKR